jgi:hypothetical protein
MPAPGNYYTDFDYRKAYGTNPFSKPSTEISSYVNRLLQGGGSSSAATGGTHVAAPDDPEVLNYMEHILGGQRKTLDDYVRQAAGAGIKRGGMNVVGGPSLDSALHHGAMSTLARGYADRFKEAMDYNKYVQGTRYSQHQDSARELQNMLGIQQRYLSSQADWQSRLGDVMHGDYRGDVDWTRQEPRRTLDLERMKDQLAMDRWKNQVEREDRTRAIYDKVDRENQWRGLAQKAGLVEGVGRFGAGWDFGDEMASDRLGVELGYLKPWDRKATVSKKSF